LQRTAISTATIDRLGVIASAACVVHCILAPVVLSFLAIYANFVPSQDYTHRVLAVLITAIAALALANGYRRHRKASVIVLMLAGLGLIFFGAFGCERFGSHWYEVVITLCGSICLVVAHRRNHTFCRRCTRCDHTH
jgi:peptidoglycan/LPS O-acetylase OafA/YrhL